jgi:gliding motility-associated-like protein
MISDNIIIEYIDGPICDFTASSYEFMLSNEPVNFYDNSSTDPNFNFQIESWIWEFGDGTISNEQNPSHLYSNPGLYYVWLTVTDENNCEQSVMKTINVLEEYYSYSPNAFSPNGDGVNDLFAPILTDIDYETYEINIFNRWGDIVFKTNNYDESWDGTFKGENLPQAVYTYKITYKTRRGIDKQERGDIVLVK